MSPLWAADSNLVSCSVIPWTFRNADLFTKTRILPQTGSGFQKEIGFFCVFAPFCGR